MSVTNSGLWQSSISVNAQTTELHTESDCTHTIINIPKQDIKPARSGEDNIIFQLKTGETIGIELKYGITFMFSGKYLTHCQSYNENTSGIDNVFIDMASYGNERLYIHIRATLHRTI